MPSMLRSLALALLASALLASAVVPEARAAEPALPEHMISREAALGIRIGQSILGGGTDGMDLSAEERDEIRRFYAERDGVPLWLSGTGLGERARLVMAEIRRAGDWGLQASDYVLPEDGPVAEGAVGIETLARREVMLSLAVSRYALHAHSGRIDPATFSDMLERDSSVPKSYDVLKGMANAAAPEAYLLGFHPKHPQFALLRQKMLELRGAAEEPPPIEIPLGPNLKPGVVHPHVGLLRKRLGVAAPDPASGLSPEDYDPVLVEAVKKWQAEHGIKVDGIVGKSIRKALNGGVPQTNSAKIERILVNMERWRWLPEEMGDLYVWNNLPEFLTRTVKHGEVIFTERIVIGKAETQTPVFSDQMEYVEFHPYWNVPESIKVKELLPGLRRGSGVLARQGLRLKYKGREVDASEVDWETADIRRFHVYQPPGGGNALGVVKFMFPNAHDVYMHDTPSKGLFASAARAFSHGCMRVRNPLKFAQLLLAEANGLTPAEVTRLVSRGQNMQVRLERKIPIHITYFTAWIEDDGKLTLRGDIYGHDRRVAMALAGKAQPLTATSLAPGGAAAKRTKVADNDPGPSLSDSSPSAAPPTTTSKR